MPSTSAATATATSGPTTRPTRWPRPRTTSRRSGWTLGQPWGVEVRLPEGFNYGSADQSNIRPVSDWRARGVTLMDGAPLPDHGSAAIIAPAGARGPGFAVYHNFFVIKKYNNATSYAMGVGHLGDRIMGGGPFQAGWPRGERELSRTEKIELQERLIARGHATGATDGVIGPDTIAAIRAFQSQQAHDPRTASPPPSSSQGAAG